MRRIKPFVWTLAVLAVLVGVYAWAGYWLAPRLIRSKLPPAIAASTGQRLALGQVVVQPFRLSVEAMDVALTEPDGTPLLGAKRLFVDAELASIWRRGLVLRAIVLDEPAVNAVLRADGALNLVSALTPKGPRPPAGDDRRSPPLVSIADIQVRQGVIDLADLRRAHPLHERLAPINVRVQDFTTSAGGEGSFRVVGRGERGASLTLDGRIAVQPFALEGNLALTGLPAETAWRLAGQYGRIAPPAGVIDLRTTYHILSAADGVRIRLDALGVEARDLALRGAEAGSDWIKVEEIQASGASVDVQDSLVRLPEIRVRGAEVHAWRDADGTVNLAALAPPKPEAAPGPVAPNGVVTGVRSQPPGVSAPGPGPGPRRSRPWRIEAPMLRVADSRVTFEDRGPATPVTYRFAPLELDVDGYASGAGEARLALRTGFNESGRLAVSGAWRFDRAAGEFGIDAQRLPVPFIQPYLDRATDLVLRGGEVSVKGQLAIERPEGAAARFAFDGGATLAHFHSIDRALREDFVRFGALALTGIRYRSSPAALRVRDVLARGAYFKLVIAPDQTTNIADVLRPRRLRRDAGGEEASDPPARDRPPGASSVAGAAADGAGPAGVSATAHANAKAAAPGMANATRAMPMRIDRIRIVDSSANFADLSIRPNFATGIEELAGTVTGLSSDPAARAEVELDGKVDRYAPVEIRGQVNYLAASSYTNLTAVFRNIELPTFTPYSGKFMGYEIARGKLDATFTYRIENRRLDAKHGFVLDQFTLGKKVESADAVHLPIRLAIALLKDRNGVIDIDLPVTGSLDDPEFRIAPLVWKALRNLLVKIATAPFALIGSLFGAGEEVRFVDFPYGSAALDGAARERLAGVGKVLTERPQLKLEVPLVADASADRAALVELRFDELLGGAAVHALRTTDPAAYLRALDAAWREATGEKRLPRPERARDEPKEAWVLRTIDAGERALRERIAVPDTGLAELARRRAEAVREALISTTGLDPARVFIVTGTPAAGATGGVRLALGVE